MRDARAVSVDARAVSVDARATETRRAAMWVAATGRAIRREMRRRGSATGAVARHARSYARQKPLGACRRQARAREGGTAREEAPRGVSRVDALRHAGATWYEVFKQREARDEIASAFVAGAKIGTRFPRAPGRAARRAWATLKRWRREAPVTPSAALRHAGGSWLDVLTHPEFKTQLGKTLARPFQPVWLRQGAIDAAEARAKAKARDVIDPFGSLRHAGASRFAALTHEKVREYYWARVVAAYVRTVVRHPFSTAMFSSVTKCVSSDIFVQMVLEEKSFFELDWNRVASFFVLGVTYVGAFQYRLYNHWLKPLNDVWRPKYGLALSTGAVVAIDQAFVQPFLYLPTFLGIRVVSEGGTRLLDLPSEIFAKWKQTGPETMTALWLVWVPAQAINFAVVPKHLTIPWMNAIGIAWNGVLSWMTGRYAAAEAAKRKVVDEEVIERGEETAP